MKKAYFDSIHWVIASFFCLCLSFSSSQAQIIEIQDTDTALGFFENADSYTLAVFDVDMVLIQPSDPAFQMKNMQKYKTTCKKILADIPSNKQMIFIALMSIGSEALLVDERFPYFFKNLAQRSVPAMALTANLTGEFGPIKSMENWRIQELGSLGIDFSTTIPYKNDHLFADLPSFRGNPAMLKKGIFFVNGDLCTKGEALLSFFKMANYYPKKVIFVDDRENNVKSVEKSLQDLESQGISIEYLGLLFLGSKNYPSPDIGQEEFEARWQALADQAKKME